jgi:hypothetical protein
MARRASNKNRSQFDSEQNSQAGEASQGEHIQNRSLRTQTAQQGMAQSHASESKQRRQQVKRLDDRVRSHPP